MGYDKITLEEARNMRAVATHPAQHVTVVNVADPSAIVDAMTSRKGQEIILRALRDACNQRQVTAEENTVVYGPAREGCVNKWGPTGGPVGASSAPVIDPRDVQYDGVALRDLLARDEMLRREQPGAIACAERHRLEPERYRPLLTATQRAAVAAHHSAEMRDRIAAAKERERRRVLIDLEHK